MKNYTVKKLDRRYSGHRIFKYIVEPVYDRKVLSEMSTVRERFVGWRDFCWTSFGPGMEREWAVHLENIKRINQPKWAWDTNYGYRLYIRGDEELVLFELKF
jgi:hypothetical protein